MSYSPAEEMFNEARSKGELYKYFGGYPEYAMQHPVADMPTDDAMAMLPIRKIAAIDPSILGEVHAAWIKLAEDPEYGWFVIHYLSDTEYLERISGKDWLEGDLVAKIADRLRANKSAYLALKKWHGATRETGCWGMVVAENYNLHKHHNITVLPEEL